MVEKDMDADVNTEADAGYYADLTVDYCLNQNWPELGGLTEYDKR
jgi:hypothetical protein